ncbi:MAG: DUF1670 domain-containing protein [Ignavibacteriaceae bacterium]
MINKADCIKRYSSAKTRFLKPVIMNFFSSEFPKLFGPIIREKLADELISLFDRNCPEASRLKPGQLLWNALDKNTRGDSPRRRYVPVILSLVTEDDILQLGNGILCSVIAKNTIARIFKEAYQQGGILSTRDVALITLRYSGTLSQMRLSYEKEHDCILPHTGVLHDMGSSISHKTIIINKIVIQKKDPATAARECNHSQKAVDRYLKDYNRVKTVFEQNQDTQYIHQVTGIAKHVVKQYINILQNEKKLSPNI